MKTVRAFVVILLLCITALPGIAAAKLEVAPQVPKATQDGIVAWADKYYSKYEPKLEGDNKETIDSIKTAFFMNKGVQYFMDETISNLVSELTLSLAARKSFDVMISASALLVKTDAKNPRVINLFGAVLNSAGKNNEALPVFEYGVSIRPKNPLLRLNLANAYLDANKDEKAKAILDKLRFEYPDDRAVWKALAAYYYKKKNVAMFRECLFKAAQFKGFAKKKVDKKQKKVEENAAEGSESPEQLEPKIAELATSEPFTSADILEDEYPAEANTIRDKYCKLQGDEKWSLPKLPQCNYSTPKNYEENQPILEQWAKVFGQKQLEWAKIQAVKMGIDLKAPKKVQAAQARKAAQKKLAESMQDAQDMLKYMKNIPGMKGVNNQYKLNQAMKKLQEAAKKQKVELAKDAPKDSEDGEEEQPDMSKIPTFDSGSPWAQLNYKNYMEIERTYEIYFLKYYKELNAKVQDIHKVYGNQAKAEKERYDEEAKELAKAHDWDPNPHGDEDFPCRQAKLAHKKRMNGIGLNFYHQWLNLYMPQYAQKMKPNLDAYWDVCMIYVRSMNDPKVMDREFSRVKSTFLLYSSMAGTSIGMGGGFTYYPETDEEERQLDADIAAAKEAAAQQAPQMAKNFQSPEFDFTKWIEDHFVVEVAGQFFALKVTAKSIQFEANAIIFSGTIKYNPVDNVLETSSGITLKANIGVNVCGVGAKLSEKVDIIKRTATWDFDKNTYVETTGGGSEGKFTIGPATVGGKVEMDSELNAKTTSKFTLFGNFTEQEQEKFPSK